MASPKAIAQLGRGRGASLALGLRRARTPTATTAPNGSLDWPPAQRAGGLELGRRDEAAGLSRRRGGRADPNLNRFRKRPQTALGCVRFVLASGGKGR